MNDINMWKYNSRIATVGFVATAAMGFAITPKLGKDVQSPYLFDDLTMLSLLMFGTVLSAIGSYWHKKIEEKVDVESRDKLEKQKSGLLPFSMFGSACLCAAALYAFDVAFFGGSTFGSPRPNAGPETDSEKVLFSILYSFVALAGMLVAYAEGRSMLKSVYPSNNTASSTSPLLASSPAVSNYSRNSGDDATHKNDGRKITNKM